MILRRCNLFEVSGGTGGGIDMSEEEGEVAVIQSSYVRKSEEDGFGLDTYSF